MRYILLISCWLSCISYLPLFAQPSSVPGGVISLKIPKSTSTLPIVRFGTQEVLLLDKKNHWEALIGIDLNTTPGEYIAFIDTKANKQLPFDQTFTVLAKKQKILSSPMPKIRYSFTDDLTYKNTVPPTLPFAYPTKALWQHEFGDFYTDKKKNTLEQINYLWSKPQKNQLITSPQKAIVSHIESIRNNKKDTGTQYRIFLNHGRGLYSIITGVSDLKVSVGQAVKKQAPLGVFFPIATQYSYLYWQCVLNNTIINPQFLTKNI